MFTLVNSFRDDALMMVIGVFIIPIRVFFFPSGTHLFNDFDMTMTFISSWDIISYNMKVLNEGVYQ